MTIRNWFVGGPLHGQINAHPDSEVVHHGSVLRPDDNEWLYNHFNEPIRAMPVDIEIHTYHRRHIQFYGSNGDIWVDRILDPHDLLPLMSALMGADQSSNGYARGGWISGSSWGGNPLADNTRIEFFQRTYPEVEMEVYGHWSLGQYGSPEAMAEAHRRRTQQTREQAQIEWERRTRARQDGERPNLFLDDELFEQTITGLTHSMTWTPTDQNDPDANRSHP